MDTTLRKLLFKLTAYLALTLVAFLIADSYQTASATTAAGVGIKPANINADYQHQSNWFIYEVDPAEISTIEDAVLLINGTNEEITVKLEAADAYVPVNGGFALLDELSDNPSIGNWVKLEAKVIKIPPDSTKVVPFTITIPDNPEVGDHIGGIIAMRIKDEPDATMQSGGATVTIKTRVASRMYLTITGNMVRDFEVNKHYIKGFGPNIIFGFKATNLGNVRTNLLFDAKIYGLFGLYDEKEKVSIGQIFPKMTLVKNVVWEGKSRPLFGPYLAIMKVYDTYEPMNKDSLIAPAPEPIATWAITFFIPYTQTAILFTLLFLIWFLRQFFTWRKMVRLTRQPVVEYKVKKDDHLFDLAKDYSIPWKLLAKLNGLEPPYSLRNVKALYIPDVSGTRRNIKLPHFLVYLADPIARLSGCFKRKVHRLRPDEQIIVIEQGDKIRDIEQFTGITWAEITVYNRLKPTFRLRAGVELVIPKPSTQKKLLQRKK